MTERLQALRQKTDEQKQKYKWRIVRNIILVLFVPIAILLGAHVVSEERDERLDVSTLMSEARGIEQNIVSVKHSQALMPSYCSDAGDIEACETEKKRILLELDDLKVQLELVHYDLAQKGVVATKGDENAKFGFKEPISARDSPSTSWTSVSTIAKVALLPFSALLLAWMLDVPMRIYNRYDALEFALSAFESDEELNEAVVTNGLLVEKLLSISDK